MSTSSIGITSSVRKDSHTSSSNKVVTVNSDPQVAWAKGTAKKSELTSKTGNKKKPPHPARKQTSESIE